MKGFYQELSWEALKGGEVAAKARGATILIK
jgi:hypothetical protein